MIINKWPRQTHIGNGCRLDYVEYQEWGFINNLLIMTQKVNKGKLSNTERKRNNQKFIEIILRG